jgi:hypothetical protein
MKDFTPAENKMMEELMKKCPITSKKYTDKIKYLKDLIPALYAKKR